MTNTKNQLQIVEPKTTQLQPATPTALLQLAVEKDLDIDKLEKLMALQERWEKEQARKMFSQAMSNFQYEVPQIKKLRKVAFGTTKYSFAGLSEISETIKHSLRANGLSYRWELKDETDTIICTCIVSHINGHSERTDVSAKKDASGGKNEIQQRGSTITYLQRYSLISALGITTADDDTDGQKPKEKEEMTPAHPKWKGAVDSLKNGAVNMAQIKANYKITPENEQLLINQSK